MTTFVVRKGTTLYISKNYTVRDEVLLAACGMLGVSLGLLKGRLQLPEPDSSWWPEAVAEDQKFYPAGVVTA